MIYSRWRPVTGGYDYYEGSGDVPLGNDLPVPDLRASSPIGAPSVDVGRQLPSDAKYIGTGPMAKGMLLPVTRNKSVLGEVEAVVPRPYLYLAVGLIVGWFIRSKRK